MVAVLISLNTCGGSSWWLCSLYAHNDANGTACTGLIDSDSDDSWHSL